MMGEKALPLHHEDCERAIQIVGSITRRWVNALTLYLIFAMPSLVMGITYVLMEFFDNSMDPLGTGRLVGKWFQLVLVVLVAGVPNLLLIWFMFRVQTKSWWRRLIVQSYFRRALQIVVGIRVATWLCFMFLDALIGMLAIAAIAIPAEWIAGLFGDSNAGLDLLRIVMLVLVPVLVITTHLFVWGILFLIVSAITGGLMKQTAFPCLWCGHEQSPTVGDRCPECGIAISESEVSRAKARGIYQPMASAGSTPNDFENSPSNA